MSNDVKVAIVAAIAEMARSKLELLDHIREKMLKSISSEREHIASLAQSADGDYYDSLLDDDHFLFEAEQTVGGLLLVGLYNAVEHCTKQLLRHRYPPNKVKQCYKMEHLQEALAKDCDVNLASLAGFDAIDELRGKSNQVKHGGRIGEPALKAYERLQTAVVPYLERLALVIVPG